MLKFSAETEEIPSRPVLGIGLSQENCNRLLQGQPILFSTEGMEGLPSMEVFIMAGPDENSMALELARLGILKDDQIREDPSLSDPHVRLAGGDVN